jgi:hypothetical protein
MLRARYVSLDQYLARNLFLIERGTHPRFLFRANLAEARRSGEASPPAASPPAQDADPPRRREEDAYRKVFDSYVEARRSCGQSTDLDFATVRDTLRRHVELIQSRYQCERVRFHVTVENGRATLKAVPLRDGPVPPADP